MESESAQASHVTVFVGGLPADTTEDDLVSLTSPDTHLCHRAWIPGKYDISKKASFGFIEVPKRIATKMLARKHYIRGRRVDCNIAIPKVAKPAYLLDLMVKRVFVNNLPGVIDESVLEACLRKHGKVRNFYLTQKSGGRLNMCFVEYVRTNDANSIVTRGLIFMKRYYKAEYYKQQLDNYGKRQARSQSTLRHITDRSPAYESRYSHIPVDQHQNWRNEKRWDKVPEGTSADINSSCHCNLFSAFRNRYDEHTDSEYHFRIPVPRDGNHYIKANVKSSIIYCLKSYTSIQKKEKKSLKIQKSRNREQGHIEEVRFIAGASFAKPAQDRGSSKKGPSGSN